MSRGFVRGLRGINGEEISIFIIKGCGVDMLSINEGMEFFFRVILIAKRQSSGTAVADKLGQGGKVTDHCLPGGDEFVSDKAGGYQEQSHRACGHDDGRKFMLDRDVR